MSSEITITYVGCPLCDFCSSPDGIYAKYPVRSFEAWRVEKADGTKLNLKSESDWVACRSCAALVDANSWDALAERGIQWFRMRYGAAMPEAELRHAICDLHRLFRENRLETH